MAKSCFLAPSLKTALNKNRTGWNMIAEVIIQSNVKNLNRIFDYKIPAEYEEKGMQLVGARVLVPFGRMKALEEGFIVNVKQTTEYEVKEIARIENIYLTQQEIELAKWMAKRYFCNVADCIKLMLPPGTTSKVQKNRVKDKSVNFVSLAKQPDEIEFDIETGKVKSDKQVRTLRFLLDNGDALVSDIEMFADSSRAVVNTLCKNGYTEMVEKKIERDPFLSKDIERTEKLELTDEQSNSFTQISDAMDEMLFSEFLIYGVTGSRKDRNLFTVNRKGTK